MKYLLTIILLCSIAFADRDPRAIRNDVNALERIDSANPYNMIYPGDTVVPRLRQNGKIDFQILVHPREGYLKRWSKQTIRPGDTVTGWATFPQLDKRGPRPHQLLLDAAFFHNRKLYNKWYKPGLFHYITYPFRWVYYRSSLDYFNYYMAKHPNANIFGTTLPDIWHYTLDYEVDQWKFRMWYIVILWPFILLCYMTVFTLPFRKRAEGGFVGRVFTEAHSLRERSIIKDVDRHATKRRKELYRDGLISEDHYIKLEGRKPPRWGKRKNYEN